MDAEKILAQALETMRERAEERGLKKERSMTLTVELFNTLTGSGLDEEDGFLFMVCLKLARSATGPSTMPDDFLDGAAYMALAGEAALNAEKVEPSE